MEEQSFLPHCIDEHDFNTTNKDSASHENLNITIGNSDMEAVAAVLKESFKFDLKESIKEKLRIMVNDIISGVVTGLYAKISVLEHENKKLVAENTDLKVRKNKLELAMDNAEQYSRRNSLRTVTAKQKHFKKYKYLNILLAHALCKHWQFFCTVVK